jgi:hypothetical protein
MSTLPEGDGLLCRTTVALNGWPFGTLVKVNPDEPWIAAAIAKELLVPMPSERVPEFPPEEAPVPPEDVSDLEPALGLPSPGDAATTLPTAPEE